MGRCLNTDIAGRYRVSRPMATLWRTLYREQGIAGLHNEIKPGRRCSSSDEQVAHLIHTVAVLETERQDLLG